MYIYIAINKVNENVYVGQTTKTVEQRKQKHFQEARSESNGTRRKSSYFHNAIRKYGEDAFEFMQLDEASSLEELNEKERFWIEAFHATDSMFGYNLDSGGNNNKRHSTTIEKLRESTQTLHRTSESYRNSSILGLRKGTEVWKEICRGRRIELTCPVCGRKFYLPPNEAKKRTYCSYECSVVGNTEIFAAHIKLASRLKHERKELQNIEISDTIYNWAREHRELVLNCPYNKISTTLCGLQEVIKQQYGLVDWRTIGSAIGCTSKRCLLQKLKQYLNENIC